MLNLQPLLGIVMNLRRQRISIIFFVASVGALGGCALIDKNAHIEAFSTQMTGINEVPSVATAGAGRVDAILDKETLLLRWKISYSGLSGLATAGHFHGPAAIGANAGVSLAFRAPITSPIEGQATLTAAQAADLIAGKWYANIHTAVHPGGEIRGQLILRKS